MRWVQKLQEKWEVKTLRQFIIIMVVFACTGFTIVVVKRPIIEFMTGGADQKWWFTIIYLAIVLPLYNIVLLSYGFLFGQFEFFWGYEKKTFRKMRALFSSKKKKDTPSFKNNQ